MNSLAPLADKAVFLRWQYYKLENFFPKVLHSIVEAYRKVHIEYADARFVVKQPFKNRQSTEEIRWKIVKAMLDDFPSLRRKVKSYADKKENKGSYFRCLLIERI